MSSMEGQAQRSSMVQEEWDGPSVLHSRENSPHSAEERATRANQVKIRDPVTFSTPAPQAPNPDYPYQPREALEHQANWVIRRLQERTRERNRRRGDDDLPAREYVEVLERLHWCRQLQLAAYDSGFILSADGKRWGVVRGREFRPFHGVWDDLLVPPTAGTRDQLRVKEVFFLQRCIADITSLVALFNAPRAPALFDHKRRHDWGVAPQALQLALRQTTADPHLSLSDCERLWLEPFVYHFWRWQLHYIRYFPEVLRATRDTEEYDTLLTDYSRDFLDFVLPALREYQSSGNLVAFRSEETRIPRSGYPARDMLLCVEHLSPFKALDPPPEFDLEKIYHTVPLEPPELFLHRNIQPVGLVGLSEYNPQDEPRRESDRSAYAFRQYFKETRHLHRVPGYLRAVAPECPSTDGSDFESSAAYRQGRI